MRTSDEIETRLRAALNPREIAVRDDSERHRGHAGWREGGETHFHVRLASDDLAGLSRIERHRRVHAALGPALLERIHALSLDLST